MNPPIPFIITYPSFEHYLDNILGIRDRVCWGKERLNEVEAIQSRDPDERHIHIEVLRAGEKSVDGYIRKEDLYVVWRKQDWVNSSQRLDKLRAKSEEERQLKFARTEQYEKLTQAIQRIMGLDEGMARKLALTIYEKGYTAMAEKLGITDINWDL